MMTQKEENKSMATPKLAGVGGNATINGVPVTVNSDLAVRMALVQTVFEAGTKYLLALLANKCLEDNPNRYAHEVDEFHFILYGCMQGMKAAPNVLAKWNNYCESHAPSDDAVLAVKKQIRQGNDPVLQRAMERTLAKLNTQT